MLKEKKNWGILGTFDSKRLPLELKKENLTFEIQ